MKVFIQIGHGIVGAAVISGFCIWQAGSFGEARHTISISKIKESDTEIAKQVENMLRTNK